MYLPLTLNLVHCHCCYIPIHLFFVIAYHRRSTLHNTLLTLVSVIQVEDRPIVKEIKTYIREHHPIEKEFVVETRPTGQAHTCIFWHHP